MSLQQSIFNPVAPELTPKDGMRVTLLGHVADRTPRLLLREPLLHGHVDLWVELFLPVVSVRIS